ncbi:MAG: hypothetical protein IBX44_00775 [Sulfurospirillum sp.]|nr:hypothetical protein [Sulfurospirillum sp.]
MKYLAGFLVFLSLIVIGLYFLVFTSNGNAFVKPYLEAQLQKKLNKKVTIESFALRTNFIDLELLAQDASRVIINGDFSLMDQAFDLHYILLANSTLTQEFGLQNLVAFKGYIKGNIEDFTADGIGEIFNAKTNFEAHIKNKKLFGVSVDTKGLQIEEILRFAKQPLYSKGLLDVSANIKPDAQNKLFGDGRINIQFGQLDAGVIEQTYAIKLPNNITYRGDIVFNLQDTLISTSSNIISNIAKVEAKKTTYDIESKKLQSDYVLHVGDLASLKELMGIELLGSLLIHGEIVQSPNNLLLTARSDLFGGKLDALLENQKANVKLEDISIQDVLTMLKQEQILVGKTDLQLQISDVNAGIFEASITMPQGTMLAKSLTHMSGKVFPKDLPSKFRFDAKGSKELLTAGGFFDFSYGVLNIDDLVFGSKEQSLRSNYALHVEDLSQLDFLLGRKIFAPLNTKGEFQKIGTILALNGASDLLDAKTDYALKDDLFTLDTTQLQTEKLTKALGYPNVFSSYASLHADYNLNKNIGRFEAEAINGKLIASQLSDLVFALSGFDMTQEIYKQSTLKGLIDHEKVDFQVLMEGLQSNLELQEGKYNLNTKQINTGFAINIQNKDIQGSIKGDIQKPKVSINSSQYLRQKLDKVIDKNVPDEWKEPVKNLLKLFN